MTKKQIAERQKFIDVYTEFDKWLSSLGFRSAKYNEGSTHRDVYYSHYQDFINAMYAVELYIHDTLRMNIRFLRDRNEHKFMIVGGDFGGMSDVYNLGQFKRIIIEEVIKLRDEELAKLSKLNTITI